MTHSKLSHPPRFAIVIPCYNEEAMLPHTLTQLIAYLKTLIKQHKITEDSFLYCVDDGSHDDTWAIISAQHAASPLVKGLKLTRNMGHQNALLAGMLGIRNRVDCLVTMDADLQDDMHAIEAMLDCYRNGIDIVYGVRKAREKDTLFKRMSAHAFYRIMKKSGADIVHDHADFRLLSHRVIESLNQFEERNLFLRGIFPLMGYPSAHVEYDRSERAHGKPQYTLKKMLSLAWDGVTSFSHIPLSLILSLGLTLFVLSLAMIVWIIAAKLMSTTVPGWASIMIPICLMGGVQLLSIGVIGEYIAKVYLEVKRRPRYIAETELQ